MSAADNFSGVFNRSKDFLGVVTLSLISRLKCTNGCFSIVGSITNVYFGSDCRAYGNDGITAVTFLAEAVLQAAIIISISMKISLISPEAV